MLSYRPIIGDDTYKRTKGSSVNRSTPWFELSYQDSNLDRQNQKLQCYHYTIRQSWLPKAIVALKRCKVSQFFWFLQTFVVF